MADFFDFSSHSAIRNPDPNEAHPAKRPAHSAPLVGPTSSDSSANSTMPVGGLLTDIVEAEFAQLKTPALSAEDETKQPAKWEPKDLKPRHREMMRRILEGATYVEIAADMGISTQSVMLVASSVIFKEELKQLEASLDYQVIRRAEELSNEALDKLKFLMRKARSEALQASCAERVLGIAGYSKIEKKQVAVISGEDVIRELNRQRRESAFGTSGHSGPSADSDGSAVSEAEVTAA